MYLQHLLLEIVQYKLCVLYSYTITDAVYMYTFHTNDTLHGSVMILITLMIIIQLVLRVQSITPQVAVH